MVPWHVDLAAFCLYRKISRNGSQVWESENLLLVLLCERDTL